MPPMSESSAAVGTLAWVQQRQGRLTPRQAVQYAAAQTRAQILCWTSSRRPPAHPVHEPRHFPAIPADEQALEIVRYSAEVVPAPIFNHSCRVWGWAATWRSADNEPVDTQLLLAACLLHDVGLAMASPATGRSCFTVRSAEKAASVLTRAGFSAGSVAAVAAAIVGHMNVVPPPGAAPLTKALHFATNLDVTGIRSHLLPASILEEGHKMYPRSGFAGCFSKSFRRELAHVPLTRAGIAYLIGLPLAVRINPISGSTSTDPTTMRAS